MARSSTLRLDCIGLFVKREQDYSHRKQTRGRNLQALAAVAESLFVKFTLSQEYKLELPSNAKLYLSGVGYNTILKIESTGESLGEAQDGMFNTLMQLSELETAESEL